MRLLTCEVDGEERLAVVAGGARQAQTLGEAELLLATEVADHAPRTMGDLLAGGQPAVDRLRAALEAGGHVSPRPAAGFRVLAPIRRPAKIVAVGRNYRQHALEEAAALPEAPLLFAKLPSAVIGPGEAITWSSTFTAEVDYEAELAVVVGSRTRHVGAAEAPSRVLGYTCVNDVSARDLQARDGQWTRAKGLDSFCPMGPWIVTVDEVPDVTALRVRCRVNGEVRQDAPVRDLVHGVPQLLAYASQAFTLDPGDVIATGTPGGVGAFRDPPAFLGDGDDVEVEIDGVGILANPCKVLP